MIVWDLLIKQVFVWLKKQLRFIYENVLEKRGCSHDEVSCDFEYPEPMHYFLCLGIVSKGTKAFEFRSITCGVRLMRHFIYYFAHKRYINSFLIHKFGAFFSYDINVKFGTTNNAKKQQTFMHIVKTRLWLKLSVHYITKK